MFILPRLQVFLLIIFSLCQMTVNTLKPRQNSHHFADDIFICIFLKESAWISIKVLLEFAPLRPVCNILELLQIMDWRRSVAKPLSDPIMVRSPIHICVTRPQWDNWGLVCQKQIYKAWVSNDGAQYSVGCTYSSMSYKPTSSTMPSIGMPQRKQNFNKFWLQTKIMHHTLFTYLTPNTHTCN